MSMLVSINNQGADKDGLIVMGAFFSDRQLWKLSEDEIIGLIKDIIGDDQFKKCCKFTNLEEQIKSKAIR
jgi:hypothetical protein